MSSFIKPSSKRNVAKKKEEESIRPSIRRKSPPRGKQPEIVKYKRKVSKTVNIVEPFIEEVNTQQSDSDEDSENEMSVERGSIGSIQFSFMSEKEVEDFAVVEITDTKLGGPNSLYDHKMGPTSKGEICETCESNWDDCPGHFGYIKLNAKFPHPLRSKNVLEYLSVFCKDCNRLVITKESIVMLGFDKYKGENRFNRIFSHIENNVTVCPCCESIIPTYTFFDDKYMMEIKDKKYPVQYDTIYKIFSNIRECDIELIGFDPKYVHPIRLMLVNLLVVPPCVRPYIRSDDGEACHDDLTYKYIDILKKNNKLMETYNEKSKLDIIDELMFHIKTLMDNNKGKAREISGKRPIKCIKQRISSKQGRIRQNIQGKRVNFSGRTVIGCEANCMVDELIIPPEVAKKLTYPIKVTEQNYKKCTDLLEQGKVNIIFQDGIQKNAKYAMWTEGFKFKNEDTIIRGNTKVSAFHLAEMKYGGSIDKIIVLPGDKVIRDGKMIDKIPIQKKKDFTLNIGDTIERQLQNGDLVVFNRQPTLWKGSMRAKRVRILPGKTFRFNLASTQAFNADFDGDEMNLWLAESENSRAECATILNTIDNFMSSQDSKPLLSLKQDAMTGGYVLTHGVIKIPKHTFFDCVSSDYFELSQIFKKMDHIRDVYNKLGKTEEIRQQILEKKSSLIKKQIEKNSEKMKTLKEEHESLKGLPEKVNRKNEVASLYNLIKAENEDLREKVKDIKVSGEELDEEILYNGHSLFSMILPDDFEYFADNKASKDGKPVLVKRGVLLSGTLNKVAIGSSSGSLIHHIAKDYGYKKASEFVSLYQILINNWFTHYGYSIGLQDCIPENTDLIESEMNKCFMKATAAIRTEKDEEMLEAQINGFLGEAITIGQKIAKDALKEDNNMVRVINSGAKGNFFNITQVTGVVGQQNVVGNRIPKTYGGRTLPHYIDYSNNVINEIEEKNQDPLPVLKDLFESRGFVRHSYFQGLTPQEYFFHASGGREGLLDTALKSVTWETEILILENGISKVVKIGEWIDEYIKNTPLEQVENHKERDMELVNIEEGKIFISTVDEDGKVSWSDITAITRHDPGKQLYKVTTLSGKQVIVTESKSLLIWEKDTKKIVHKSTPDVKVGDFVPVTMNLQEPPIIYEYIDMTKYLPKQQYIYGTDFHKAVNMLNEEMNKPVRGNDIRTKIKRGWWNSNNNNIFTLPYPNKARLQRAISGRSNIENIKQGYIYPYDANREERLIPEMFPLNRENGIFIGLFLAEGNTDGGSVRISNNNEGVISFIKNWFSKHLIKYEFEDRINNIGGRSISVRGSSMILSKFLDNLLGKGSQNKYVPNEAFTASNEFIIGLLNGYFSGDGSVYDNAITVSSASKPLIDGISSLCSRLGIFCKQSKTHLKSNNLNTENILPSYTLSIRAQWASVFSKKIDLIDTDKNDKLQKIKPSLEHRNFDYQNDVVLDKIVDIELIDPKEYPKVYDLTVPKTLNFCLFNNLGVADTANTGYIQRKMIKMVEDLKFGYTNVVSNAKDNIIEFMYGEDNMDASKLINTREGLSFVDINHINEKLNAEIEFN